MMGCNPKASFVAADMACAVTHILVYGTTASKWKSGLFTLGARA
jgi:hypothetical protein